MAIVGVELQIDGASNASSIEILIGGFSATAEGREGLEAGVEIYRRRGTFTIISAGVAISAVAVDDAGAGLIAPDAIVSSRLLGEGQADEVDGLLAVVWIWRAPVLVRTLAMALGVVVVVVLAVREGGAAGVS